MLEVIPEGEVNLFLQSFRYIETGNGRWGVDITAEVFVN